MAGGGRNALLRDLKPSQFGEFLNVSFDDDFRASAAIVIPAPAVPHTQAYLALFEPVPGIGLAVMCFARGVDFDLDNKGLNSGH
jgi:hypothetical protein